MCLQSLVTLLLLVALCPPLFAQAPAPVPDQAPDPGLLQNADAIAAQVATMRALPVRMPIQKDIKTRLALRTVLRQKVEAEFTPDQFLHESLVYQRLDLLPQGTDYKQMILDLYTQQIAGFYDPETKKLSLIKGLPSPLQRATMAHEIFHAIQDQHFPLAQLQHAPDDFQDYRIARHALIEGDATLLTLDFGLHEQGELPREGRTTMAQIPALRLALGSLEVTDAAAMSGMFTPDPDALAATPPPALITSNMLFPYTAGLRFVLAAFDHFGAWAPMHAIYLSPPVSTEHILHPERYFQNDLPTILSFTTKDALPTPWTPIYTAQLGEFQMRLILREWSTMHPGDTRPEIDPDAAAAGWDGDRMLAWKDPEGRILVVHLSVWDSPKEAIEYYQTMQKALGIRWQSATSSMTLTSAQGAYGQASCIAHTTLTGPAPQHEHAYLEQWGDLVLLIEGLPAKDQANMAPLRDAIFSTLKRTPWAALPASTFQMHSPSPSNAPSR